ncbi:MAG TPA: hypothetical protein VNQ79_01465 [Blastocatellia bacterium]|nr:hypothetical protein [Blastocatellia bacterium]
MTELTDPILLLALAVLALTLWRWKAEKNPEEFFSVERQQQAARAFHQRRTLFVLLAAMTVLALISLPEWLRLSDGQTRIIAILGTAGIAAVCYYAVFGFGIPSVQALSFLPRHYWMGLCAALAYTLIFSISVSLGLAETQMVVLLLIVMSLIGAIFIYTNRK